jgi:Tfp pilus assembly protein PilF
VGARRRDRSLRRHGVGDSWPAGPRFARCEAAARWFRAALAAGPSDRAAAHCDLAESYLATGQAPQAKRQVLAALEVAPTYARAQDLLLAIVDGSR